MIITKIEESGNNQTLLWAIRSHANIAADRDLMAIINSELFYLITIEDVSFFELFRLTQEYREKVRILNESKVAIPNKETLQQLFGGSTELDGNTMVHADIAEHAISLFSNMAMQMYADDNIIQPSAARMFIPMINRKYTIQIPYNFADLVYAINPENDGHGKVFNTDYPKTLINIMENNPYIANMILLNMTQVTMPIKYQQHYSDLIKAIKYFPLAAKNGSARVGLVGFRKYNNITRGETSCSLFKLNPDDYDVKRKIIASLNEPLKIDFAIQAPIQVMQVLENSFSTADLPVHFESSMAMIIEDGLQLATWAEENISEDYASNLSAYKQRIAESEQTMLNVINVLLRADPSIVDTRSVFAMLPSIYMTKAIVTYDCSKKSMYKSSEPHVNAIFDEMHKIADSITDQINQ